MSPKGFEGVRNASADIERRRQGGGGGGGSRWFGLKDGESATVRFLEQGEDVAWCWQHELPYSSTGKSWGDKIVCRDTSGEGEPCPGCEANLKRGFRGFANLIVRDAPKYAEREDGSTDWDNVVGVQDAVMLWEGGITVFEELDAKDSTYKGLGSRDFKITRKGTQFNTRYQIEPADPDAGPQPLSDADKKLAEDKQDLAEHTTPLSYEDWKAKLTGGGDENGGASEQRSVNPFMDK